MHFPQDCHTTRSQSVSSSAASDVKTGAERLGMRLTHTHTHTHNKSSCRHTWTSDGVPDLPMLLKLSVAQLHPTVLLEAFHTHTVLVWTVEHHHHIPAKGIIMTAARERAASHQRPSLPFKERPWNEAGEMSPNNPRQHAVFSNSSQLLQ